MNMERLAVITVISVAVAIFWVVAFSIATWVLGADPSLTAYLVIAFAAYAGTALVLALNYAAGDGDASWD